MKNVVIIAPHADDEIIGCHSILDSMKNITVLFPTIFGLHQAEVSKEFGNFETGLFKSDLEVKTEETYFFPDPYFELHPAHRRLGAIGEKWAREGYDVVFYSTNMNAPYIHEVENWSLKKHILDVCYPDKADLWKYDHKYFLFEGHCKWIFK